MTKAQLLKALEPLDDDAEIKIEIDDPVEGYNEVWDIDDPAKDIVMDIVKDEYEQNKYTIYFYRDL